MERTLFFQQTGENLISGYQIISFFNVSTMSFRSSSFAFSYIIVKYFNSYMQHFTGSVCVCFVRGGVEAGGADRALW